MIKSLLVSALLVGGVAFADDSADQPTTVSVPLSTAYIPGGFDSNDRAQVVVEGYFPNTCYRVGPYEKKLNTNSKELSVTQLAYKYRGACLMMVVPFNQTVQVGILKADNYTVKDGNNGKVMGALPVHVAHSTAPDDYLYASVNDAYVGVVDGSKRAIVMQGELPGDCWALKANPQVQMDAKNVVTVLPVIEKVRETNCNDYRMPFMTTVELPKVEAGRYLLHVRSLNGQAVNKLVDL